MTRMFVARLCMAAGLVVCLCAPAVAGVKAGQQAVELTKAKDRSGKALSLAKYRGKVVVLTFGASWCKPCRKELPAYEALAKKYAKAGADVVFIAINIDSDRANADKFLKETGVKTMRVGFDAASKIVEKYEPPTMPTTYLIDRKGVVKHVHPGYEKGDEKVISKQVDGLLR